MRRVIDDTHYEEISHKINTVLHSIKRKDVLEYDNGMERSQSNIIMNKVLKEIPKIKFGNNCNTTGIGNNKEYEIIYTGDPKEEQICGIIHLTNNMFGYHICWVSDIDRDRKTENIKI